MFDLTALMPRHWTATACGDAGIAIQRMGDACGGLPGLLRGRVRRPYHADACTALACLNESLPPFHYMIVQFGGDDVRCAPYVTFGTPALADAAAAAIRGRNACLLANHGMIACGGSAADALARSILLETLCRQYLLARSAGAVRLLTAEEMRAAQERYRSYGQPAQVTGPRAQAGECNPRNGDVISLT